MKTEKYEKVYIKSESDLPTTEGEYFLGIKGEKLRLDMMQWHEPNINVDTEYQKEYWLNTFDWYLRPIPEQTETVEPTHDLPEIIHEREALFQAFDKIRASFKGRHWLMEGRGSYPYDDERYKEEVRYIMDEFEEINNSLWKQIKSKSFEYRNAIEAPLKKRIEELESQPKQEPRQGVEEIRNEVARRNNFDSFDRAIRYTFNRELLQSEKEFINKLFDESMEEYASQKQEISLSDEEIKAESFKRFTSNTGYVEDMKQLGFVRGAKWAVDRIKNRKENKKSAIVV